MKNRLYAVTLGFAAALLLGGVPALSAQTAPSTANQSGDHDTTRAEVANFDKFLDSHPEVAEDLRKNPNLVNNADYVRDHPGLRDYLEDHPGVREEVKENPKAFMKREGRFERTEDRRGKDNDTTRAEAANFDKFLDGHPEVAEDLRKNPNLVNNPTYVNNHPGLRDYLQDHPNVREEVKENPKAFMKREKQYEKHEPKNEDARHFRRARAHR